MAALRLTNSPSILNTRVSVGENKIPEFTEGASAPWSRISFGPPAETLDIVPADPAVPARDGDHITYFRWERQVDLQANTSFHATTIRLETAVAVQHQSQWRVDLDPRRHRLIVHWLRIKRGAEEFDHLRRERMRLIQRETQLEHLVIDGQWTLLVVLDDVRIGDVVEAAYSFVGGDPIRPGGCEIFFGVPSLVVVGSYRLKVQFDEGQTPLTWLASADAPARLEETLPGNRVRWTWNGQQLDPREAEPNQPSTFLDYTWVQISDLNEWQPLSTRLAEVWQNVSATTDIIQLPGFAPPVEVNEASVHQLIQYLQDEFRYLSVDLENGGWIPAQPAVVARRRYGDCKDLAWLAASVLRAWGLTACPILVATGLRERVQELRPMALLFNHAVVEVEIGERARWFDLTMRNQGGDFATEVMPWFGIGLPVVPGASLRKQPGTRAHGLYAVRETIELDTRRGKPSVVEMRVRAEGWNADLLRCTRLGQGADGFTKERLAHARRRYGKAERIGGLEWRDDRVRNVCELVEAFEVREIANPTEGDQRAVVDIPGNLLMQSLGLPEQKIRRAPWDLPRALELRHEICARARSMGAGERARRRWVCPEFAGTIEDTREKGCWRKVTRFSIKADAVPVERIDPYRQLLEQLLVATTWRLYLPWNQSRVAARPEFGKLPAADEGIAAFVPAADLDDFADATPEPATTTILTPTPQSFWNANWRYIVPVLVLAGGALTRTLETPSQVGSTLPPDERTPFVRPSNPQDAVRFFESQKVASEDEPLPPSPEIKGEVYVDARTVDAPPQAISRTPPNYPHSLRAINVQGYAVIEFVVTDEGIPAAITVVKQSHAAFGKAACLAVSKWRFRPAVKAGQRVNMKLQAPINFSLAN